MWHVGDLVAVNQRYSMHYTPDPGGIQSTGFFRITAVKLPRCYVDHVCGTEFVHGINGWDNKWFDASDERVMLVERMK